MAFRCNRLACWTRCTLPRNCAKMCGRKLREKAKYIPKNNVEENPRRIDFVNRYIIDNNEDVYKVMRMRKENIRII